MKLTHKNARIITMIKTGTPFQINPAITSEQYKYNKGSMTGYPDYESIRCRKVSRGDEFFGPHVLIDSFKSAYILCSKQVLNQKVLVKLKYSDIQFI